MQRVLVSPATSVAHIQRLCGVLSAQKDAFDEWHLWVCTRDEDAVRELQALATAHPWIVCVTDPTGTCEPYVFHNYAEYCRGDTLYLRLSEHTAWLCPGFCTAMLRAAQENPLSFAIHANAVGNPALAHRHAAMVASSAPAPAHDINGESSMHPTFAADMRQAFATAIESGAWESWASDDADMPYRDIVPLDACAWRGANFGTSQGRMGMNDVFFVCRDRPAELGQCCRFLGSAPCLLDPGFEAMASGPNAVQDSPATPPAEAAAADPADAEAPVAPRKRRITRRRINQA